MKIYKRFKAENEITLYNGDCLKLLKQIPDGVVDVIITYWVKERALKR